MSSNFGAMSPFMDRVHKLSQFVQHPIDSMFGTSPQDQPAGPTPGHDAAVQQMNQQAQADRVRQATQSYAAPKIEDQKRPLKTK